MAIDSLVENSLGFGHLETLHPGILGAIFHNVKHGRWIDRPRSRPTHKSFQWRQAHTRIDAFALSDATHGTTAAEMSDDDRDVFFRLLDLARDGVEDGHVG